jgi:hypothetical protein
MKLVHSTPVPLFFVLFILFISNSYTQTITYGDSATLGSGKIKTWVQTSASGNPEEIGILLTEDVLTSLPAGGSAFSLNFPAVTNDSLFKHMLLNWNPTGHPPIGVYNLPHFDIHYYLISRQERETIPGGPDPFTILPEYVAPDYVSDPAAIPQMGTHWIDTTSGELHGEVFTQTFIYGYYGKLIFFEPMITVDYLETHPDTVIDIKQPEAFELEGYYPTTYSIKYVNQEYHVVLKDFIFHTATPVSVDDTGLLPSQISLSQNYPNPFNPSTRIKYVITEAAKVKLAVYDILGNEVATLVNGERNAGVHEVEFDGKDLTSGVYIYKLTAGNFVESKKLMLLK